MKTSRRGSTASLALPVTPSEGARVLGGPCGRWVSRFLLAMALGFTTQVHAAIPEPLPIAGVIAAARAGDDVTTIISRLKKARTTYALRGSDFGKLATAGVPAALLDSLQQGFVDDVDLLVRYWVGGETMGPCPWCYPQQVDLGQAAATGGAGTFPPPLRVGFGRPLGLPDWYRPAGVNAGRHITVEQVREAVKAGKPGSEIVQTLRNANLDDVIGIGGVGSFGTRLQAGISGSRFAALRAEGVPDPVLDELQVRYLAMYVEYLRQRHNNLGKGKR